MMENIIEIDTSGNKYSFDFLTCFEKPVGLVLDKFGEDFQSLFLTYLKLLQVYKIDAFDAQELYSFDYNSVYKWIVNEKLNLQMNVLEVESGDIHSIIEKQIDAKHPLLITVNLKDLYYSSAYRKADWRYIFIVNGYDREKGIYSIIDTTTTRFNGESRDGEIYEPFVIEYSLLEKLYISYEEAYPGESFISHIENKESLLSPLQSSWDDIFNLFVQGMTADSHRELDYLRAMQEIAGEDGKKAGKNSDFTKEVDFGFARILNYKEIFFKEFLYVCQRMGFEDSTLKTLSANCESLLKSWARIKNQSIIYYQLNRKPEMGDKIEEVLQEEAAMRRLVETSWNLLERSGVTGKGDRDAISLHTGIPTEDDLADAGGEMQAWDTSGHTESDFDDGIESTLATLWKELLNRDVGPEDNFTDLGGHSLTAVRLVSMIIKEFDVEIPVEVFFRDPTIRANADYIRKHRGATRYTPILPAQDLEFYPLSAAQKRLFVVDQLNKNSIVYNVTIAMELQGRVNSAIVEKIFLHLIERHSILRTLFSLKDGVPVQYTTDSIDFQLEHKTANRENVVETIHDFVKPFDLFHGPLFRVMLLDVDSSGIVVFDVPHIIMDGVSVGILLREFAQLYNNNSQPLSPLSIQYHDYSMWQKDLLQSSVVKEQEQYWIERFQGNIPLLRFPLDYPRPAIQNFEGETIHLKIDNQLKESVEKLAKKHEVTLYMILFAVYNVVLHKYTGQRDIIVGSPVADRPHADLHNLVGMFVNMMPIRNFPDPEKSFSEFLLEVRENSLAAYRNQDCQFEVLVEQLGIKGNLESNPLFNVVFALQNIDFMELKINNGLVYPYQFRNPVSKFDILFEVLENSDVIDIFIEYSTTLFKQSTIRRFGEHFVNALGEITRQEDLKISEINLLSDEEKEQILYRFNDTAREYSRDGLMHQLFESKAEEVPNQTAVEFKNVSVSYSDLNKITNKIARTLRANGMKRGDYTGIILERSVEMVEGVLSVLKAGGAYIPLEPYLPDERIRKILDDLHVETLLTSVSQLERIVALSSGLPDLKNIVCLDIHGDSDSPEPQFTTDKKIIAIDSNHSESEKNLVAVNTSEDVAYVIFTSGSTGTPKGVVVKHRPVINLIEWVNQTFHVNENDKVLFITSLSFDLSVYDIFGMLAAGGTIHLKSTEEVRDPKLLLNSLMNDGITFWDSAPQALQQVSNHFDNLPKNFSNTLRIIFMSGDWIPIALPDRLREYFDGVRVIGLGGATEATIWSNYFPIGKVEPHWISIPYGKPIWNAAYYVLDKALKPCPFGVAGDLYIGGECLASGYINDQELSDKKFIANPFLPGEKMYRTGDMARLGEDGNIEFLGRADHQVKVRGFRIELGEIESNLLQHELIREAVVLAKGEKMEDKILTAYFVADKKFTVTEIREYLARELPEYMIPASFVQLESLPLTSNGKLDRVALETVKEETIEIGSEYISPSADLEIKIAEIWKSVLKREEIGVNDNFFDAGGTSLSFLEVNNKLNEVLQMEIPVIKMFQYPTIRSLEQYLQDLQKVSGSDTGKEKFKKEDDLSENFVSSFAGKMQVFE